MIPIMSVLEGNFECIGICNDATTEAYSFSDVNLSTIKTNNCKEGLV